MCDIIVTLPQASAEHSMLFGKNSDRYRNEAHVLECFPAAEHGPHEELRCTHITVPQAPRTNTVLICRPFWIWGAEMGANEHGVVIGNEGLLARGLPPAADALTGMDLVRLALERAATAEEALQVLTVLLERYDQGGNCGHLKASYYHNSFMIADASSAFVVETVGREWLAEKVEGFRSISNCYSIGSRPDRISAGLTRLVQGNGWSADPSPSFAEAIADPKAQFVGDSAARMARSTALLQAGAGRLDVRAMMSILRDHGDGGAAQDWHPQDQHRRTLCVHPDASGSAVQTTGSLVSEVSSRHAVHWVTGTAAPCISIFKPVMLDVPLPAHGPAPADRYDPRTLWWNHERMHRSAVLGDFAGLLAEISTERDALEASFRTRVAAVVDDGSAAERSQVLKECWREALDMEARWLSKVEVPPSHEATPYFAGWDHMNDIAGVNLASPALDEAAVPSG